MRVQYDVLEILHLCGLRSCWFHLHSLRSFCLPCYYFSRYFFISFSFHTHLYPDFGRLHYYAGGCQGLRVLCPRGCIVYCILTHCERIQRYWYDLELSDGFQQLFWWSCVRHLRWFSHLCCRLWTKPRCHKWNYGRTRIVLLKLCLYQSWAAWTLPYVCLQGILYGRKNWFTN